ncbi:hypothetical protein A4S06_10995 [Erysipelotrichaceae bacterium MTC7]|nr:hypothetical protein A4S06_10995 [Erysipelotrichaceae bacterium MTC7]
MNKLLEVLHKAYDKDFYKQKAVKEKKQQMEETFKKWKIPYTFHHALDYFHNEIIMQGIKNKQAFETCHSETRVKMVDFYQTLNYDEKRRLMNREIELIEPNLPKRMVDDVAIYVPFFDKRMNEIYHNEMVLYDIKKYGYYKERFENAMQDIQNYGNIFYQEDFCSAKKVFEEDTKLALYYEPTHCLYFIKDGKLVEHLSFPVAVEALTLMQISYVYFHKSVEVLVNTLMDEQLILPKEKKKLIGMLRKGIS